MDGEETGFKDKQGKPIHYGDILQLGLGISDRVQRRVVRFGKHVQLFDTTESEAQTKYGGYNLTNEHSKLAVILYHHHKPFL
ncbi:hypothetical protein H7097_04195 [Aeromicrobium sp.]|nr:hypothetical protein [Candidatus Saccharibacteria bacterium]